VHALHLAQRLKVSDMLCIEPASMYSMDLGYLENWSMRSGLAIAAKTVGQSAVGRAHIEHAIGTHKEWRG